MTTKELPDNWWDHGINPIVGYKIPRPSEKSRIRDKFEYPEEDNYVPKD